MKSMLSLDTLGNHKPSKKGGHKMRHHTSYKSGNYTNTPQLRVVIFTSSDNNVRIRYLIDETVFIIDAP